VSVILSAVGIGPYIIYISVRPNASIAYAVQFRYAVNNARV